MVLALVFIDLVLSAQFESFRDPVIVLSVVPVAIVDAGLGLIAVGGSLNAYSFIGLVTLVGLVAKNGILITEFANQLRDEGRTIEEAVAEAAATRLRPLPRRPRRGDGGGNGARPRSGCASMPRVRVVMPVSCRVPKDG
ncbi:hypothetical protein BKE38_00065 [Pseudoroseomonas deserti]|uniref:Acriflavin resistance protein n=2 Tax=Teichococcus deserti TaxID=1817963 RepID=A0A1V2H9Q1_9PROT|nr:efflux RND transporter permease subunit [Pseudoroseomonas deserti]ONG59110.1 hypothetical protein BKE38_00065 [Pseudoroseomonas deserti]